jgi:hypothetical protein
VIWISQEFQESAELLVRDNIIPVFSDEDDESSNVNEYISLYQEFNLPSKALTLQ